MVILALLGREPLRGAGDEDGIVEKVDVYGEHHAE
jgi:hypothetical protein